MLKDTLTLTAILTSITRSSAWPSNLGAAAAAASVADYKKDFFRNKVFGSVEKLREGPNSIETFSA